MELWMTFFIVTNEGPSKYDYIKQELPVKKQNTPVA